MNPGKQIRAFIGAEYSRNFSAIDMETSDTFPYSLIILGFWCFFIHIMHNVSGCGGGGN